MNAQALNDMQRRVYDLLKRHAPVRSGNAFGDPYWYGREHPGKPAPASAGARGSAAYAAWLAGRDTGQAIAVAKAPQLAEKVGELERIIVALLELYEAHYPKGCECDASVGHTCTACHARAAVAHHLKGEKTDGSKATGTEV
jgi:hypothetical protein